MTLHLRWGAASDTGLVRPQNEDAAVAEEGLFAVADGMGGHAAGEVASRVAIEVLRSHAGEGLTAAVKLANQAVLERASEDPKLRGMGTTLCAMTPTADADHQVEIVNVGDSRVYLLRDGELSQVTEDHSYVADLERQGRITAAEARVHPQRNIVTRVLGNEEDVDVDVFAVDAFRGDRFVLCSDGLFDELDDDTIAASLRRQHEPQAACDELVTLARQQGGRDNITLVVVDVLDDDHAAERASEALAAGAAATATRATTPPPGTTTGTVDETIAQAAVPSSPRDATIQVGPTRRRVTWRAVAFVLAVIAVFAVAMGSIVIMARGTYYVAVDDGEVTIFQGRPDGLLWFDPTVEQRTGIDPRDVPSSIRRDLGDGREFSALEDARAFVRTIRQQVDEARAARTTTTTTTSTTTTTTPPAPTTSQVPPA